MPADLPISNRCKSAVLREGADVGFAFDGDADRRLAVDRFGAVVDGDQLLAILSLAFRSRVVSSTTLWW